MSRCSPRHEPQPARTGFGVVPAAVPADCVSARAEGSHLGGAGRRGLSLRDAHRRGQEPLLPVAGDGARRADPGRLAADRADEGPGRPAPIAGPAGDVHQQHALRRRAVRPPGEDGGGSVPVGVRGAGTISQLPVPGSGSQRGVEAAGGGRGPLHQRVGARFPSRLFPAGRVSPAVRRPHHHRPDRHRHRLGAARHHRATQPPPAADVHHRLRPAQPVPPSAVPRHRAPEGRDAPQFPTPDARIGHRLRLHPKENRGGGGDDRRRAAPLDGRLSRRLAARPAPHGPRGVHERPDGDRGGNHRLRHGDRQGQCPLRGALHPAGQSGGVLPGGGPGRARREALAMPAPLQPRRPLDPGVLHRECLPGPRPRRPCVRLPQKPPPRPD